MVAPVWPVDFTQRLVEQINALSQLTESLAFRVVELEERLAASEQHIKPLLEADLPNAGTQATALRLEDTEERIARLESLLGGVGSIGMAHSLPARLTGSPAALEHPEDPDPFVEEGEQPFMDELAA